MKRLAFLVLLAACSDSAPTIDPAALPGELVVSLRSSGPALGAVRFTISGGAIAQVTAADPSVTIFTSTSGDDVAVVAIGRALDGALVRIRVPDVRNVSSYRTAVAEMVDTENQKLAGGESYGLVIEPLR